jgi:hypothetical protein
VSIKELGISSLIAMICALVTASLFVFAGGKILGPYMLAWPLQIAGLIALVIAVRRHRHWWLLWFLPILIAPLIIWLMLIYACANGNCL